MAENDPQNDSQGLEDVYEVDVPDEAAVAAPPAPPPEPPKRRRTTFRHRRQAAAPAAITPEQEDVSGLAIFFGSGGSRVKNKLTIERNEALEGEEARWTWCGEIEPPPNVDPRPIVRARWGGGHYRGTGIVPGTKGTETREFRLAGPSKPLAPEPERARFPYEDEAPYAPPPVPIGTPGYWNGQEFVPTSPAFQATFGRSATPDIDALREDVDSKFDALMKRLEDGKSQSSQDSMMALWMRMQADIAKDKAASEAVIEAKRLELATRQTQIEADRIKALADAEKQRLDAMAAQAEKEREHQKAMMLLMKEQMQGQGSIVKQSRELLELGHMISGLVNGGDHEDRGWSELVKDGVVEIVKGFRIQQPGAPPHQQGLPASTQQTGPAPAPAQPATPEGAIAVPAAVIEEILSRFETMAGEDKDPRIAMAYVAKKAPGFLAQLNEFKDVDALATAIETILVKFVPAEHAPRLRALASAARTDKRQWFEDLLAAIHEAD